MIKYIPFVIIFFSHTISAELNDEDVNNFVEYMSNKHSYNKTELNILFDNVKTESRIKKYFKKAPERTLTWNGCGAVDKKCTNYKNLFVTKKNINNGLKFWKNNNAALIEAEAIYGVPPEIIVAIIGIESKYGLRTGSFKTFDTLASLSLGSNKGRRAKFYKSELINFLLMCRENQLDPSSIKGSYAGALGKPQFISSSYRHYAVDFDSDGKVDLWNSNSDVIGSVANYFKKNGWQSYDDIMTPISYSKSDLSNLEEASKKTYKPQTKYSEFKKDLILSDVPMRSDIYLSVIGRKEPNRKEYSFGHKNFYVITRYNRSRLYALAVYYLSEEIKIAKSKI
tara:strand:- start:2109 stop:3125 length:1017 start_codon:yes stop_codon:yes gene_type:complete